MCKLFIAATYNIAGVCNFFEINIILNTKLLKACRNPISLVKLTRASAPAFASSSSVLLSLGILQTLVANCAHFTLSITCFNSHSRVSGNLFITGAFTNSLLAVVSLPFPFCHAPYLQIQFQHNRR